MLWDVTRDVRCEMCGKHAPRTARMEQMLHKMIDVADMTGWAAVVFPLPDEPPYGECIKLEESYLCPKCGKRLVEFAKGL